MPTNNKPNMMDSLWIPPTRCKMVNGLRMPSHSADSGDTRQRRARQLIAHPATIIPPMDNSRWAITPKRMELEVTALTRAARPRATGP